MRSLIAGTGSYAPEKVLTNADLERLVADQRPVDRRAHRHPRAPHRRARAGHQRPGPRGRPAGAGRWPAWRPEDVELIVVGHGHARTTRSRRRRRCCRPSWATRRPSPSTSRRPAPARSTRSPSPTATCRSGAVKNALVIGAESLTRITDWTDRNTCILFGDGAGAMVLAPHRRPAPRHLSPHAPHRRLAGPILLQPGGGSRDPISEKVRPASGATTSKMNGREVYKVAVRALEETCPRGAGRGEARARRRHLGHRPPGQQANPGRDPAAGWASRRSSAG